MKKNSLRIIAGLLATTMVLGSLSGCGSVKEEVADAVLSNDQLLTQVVDKVIASGSSTANKEETVYVKTNSQGDVSSVIVSNWLKNDGASEKLVDSSNLTDIVNVKGQEGYTLDGDSIVWDAQGNDIYYQGKTDKELPISVNIKYSLDGKEMTADEIAGKSGHVKIDFEYSNNSKETVEIGGKEQVIYTPFVVASGILMDQDNFKNVTVTNGTMVSDGSRQIVLGMAFPGLVDSLNGDEIKDSEILEKLEEKLNIPSGVTIEADTDSFELGMSVTVVSSDIMNALGLDELNVTDGIDDAKESVNELTEAGSQLLDGTGKLNQGASDLYAGTGKLKDGSSDLYDGVVEYTNGVSKVSTGISQLSEGASKLDSGIGELSNGASVLDSGASSLKTGITTAKGGALTLNQGIKKVDSGAASLKSGIESAAGGASSLDAGIKQVDDGANALVDGATALESGIATLAGQVGTIADGVNSAANAASSISSGISAISSATAVETTSEDTNITNISLSGTIDATTLVTILEKNGIKAEAFAAAGISQEQFNAIEEAILAVVPTVVDQVATQAAREAAVTSANTVKGQINAAINADAGNGMSLLTGSQALAGSLSTSVAQLSSEENTQKIQALVNGATSLKNGVSSLKTGTSQLVTGSGQLVSGMNTLSAGATDLATGTAQLASGSNDLYKGMEKLENGATDLATGTAKLSAGVTTLQAGSSSMVKGANELNSGASQLTANSEKLVSGSYSLLQGAGELSDGAFKLMDGSRELNEGMVKFDEEGLSKISGIFDTNLVTMQDRVKAISDAAKSYTSFDGTKGNEDCVVRFIIESEGVSVK